MSGVQVDLGHFLAALALLVSLVVVVRQGLKDRKHERRLKALEAREFSRELVRSLQELVTVTQELDTLAVDVQAKVRAHFTKAGQPGASSRENLERGEIERLRRHSGENQGWALELQGQSERFTSYDDAKLIELIHSCEAPWESTKREIRTLVRKLDQYRSQGDRQ